jgi:hypothetical protein
MDQQIANLQTLLEDRKELVERHQSVLDSLNDDPDRFEDEEVEAYLEALDEAFQKDDPLEAVESVMEPLEEAAERAEQAFMAGAQVLVDGQSVADVRLVELEPPKAALLVASPAVNKVRGAQQLIELQDGRQYAFSVEETLVADVADDKTGDLKLVLSLEQI